MACLKEIGLPAVLKVDGSWGGDGVAVVKTVEEARAAFRRLGHPPSPMRSLARAARRRDGHWLIAAVAPLRRAVSVQRFIEAGQPPAHSRPGTARLSARCIMTCWSPTACRSAQRHSAGGLPGNREATRLIAKHFGLSGLHGLDFIRDDAGHVHLLEINPRATQGGTLPFGPGRDLAAALTSCLSSRATLRRPIPNDTVVFFPNEWANNPASTFLKEGYHDVPWDDPMVLRMCLAGITPPASVEKFIRENAATEFEFDLAGTAPART